jgi:hypothetical protein
LLYKIPTRDRLAGKTKQGETAIVNYDLHISIIKTMVLKSLPSYSEQRNTGSKSMRIRSKTLRIKVDLKLKIKHDVYSY